MQFHRPIRPSVLYKPQLTTKSDAFVLSYERELAHALDKLQAPLSVLSLVVFEIEIALGPSPVFEAVSLGGHATSVVGLVLDFTTGFALSGLSVGLSALALVTDKITRSERLARLSRYRDELNWYDQQAGLIRSGLDLVAQERARRSI